MDFELLFGKALFALIDTNGGSIETALDDMEINSPSLRQAIKDYCEWDEE